MVFILVAKGAAIIAAVFFACWAPHLVLKRSMAVSQLRLALAIVGVSALFLTPVVSLLPAIVLAATMTLLSTFAWPKACDRCGGYGEILNPNPIPTIGVSNKTCSVCKGTGKKP